jgi:hypothetical protein
MSEIAVLRSLCGQQAYVPVANVISHDAVTRVAVEAPRTARVVGPCFTKRSICDGLQRLINWFGYIRLSPRYLPIPDVITECKDGAHHFRITDRELSDSFPHLGAGSSNCQ